jgi:D-sedoheptulose 7-phosphate isomerase
MLGATPQRYLEALEHLVCRLDVSELTAMADAICAAYRQRRTVFCFGNGGNAATASHFAADLTKLTVVPRLPHRLRAVSLNDSVSAMTAIGNDLEFDEIFSEQLRTYLTPGDVVLGLSTSGTSPNVVKALEYGEAAGAVTMSITGASGHLVRSLSSHCVMIESTSVQHVEELTLVATHLLCILSRATLLEFASAEDHEEAAVPAMATRAARPAVSA